MTEHDAKPEGGVFDEPLVDGAPQHWALYPETLGFPVVPNKQVLPTGMWPWESPVAKMARAAKGENPGEPPKDFDKMMAEALGFPFAPHSTEEHPDHPARTGTVEQRAAQAAAQRSHPPAASQH
jgi:hypothetical protein